MILENLEKGMLFRKYVILGILLLFLAIKLFFKPFPYYYLGFFSFLFTFSLVFPLAIWIKKRPFLNAGQIRLILVCLFIFELITFCFLLILFLPIAVYYRVYIGFLSIPIFTFYSVWIYPFLLSRKYSDFFYIISFILLVALSVLEQKGIYPSYPNYPAHRGEIFPLHFLAIPIAIGALTLFLFRNTMDHFWKRFIDLNFELRKLSRELEKKVQTRTRELERKTEELEEAKKILQVKVQARTRELEELAQKREEIIKERTKELRKKIKELEKFYKATVGRELKMIALKKEIAKLRTKLKSKE